MTPTARPVKRPRCTLPRCNVATTLHESRLILGPTVLQSGGTSCSDQQLTTPRVCQLLPRRHLRIPQRHDDHGRSHPFHDPCRVRRPLPDLCGDLQGHDGGRVGPHQCGRHDNAVTTTSAEEDLKVGSGTYAEEIGLVTFTEPPATAVEVSFTTTERSVSFSAAMSACEKGHRWCHVVALLSNMSAVSVTPNVVNFSAAVRRPSTCSGAVCGRTWLCTPPPSLRVMPDPTGVLPLPSWQVCTCGKLSPMRAGATAHSVPVPRAGGE